MSQYLQQIGQFIRRDLFQLVRDIRWIDERITFHADAREGQESAEITLKGLWTDLVDGVVQGQRVSANIFTTERTWPQPTSQARHPAVPRLLTKCFARMR